MQGEDGNKPEHLGSLLEAVDSRISTTTTGTPKVEPGEEFCSWRPGHRCGLYSTSRVMDARKSHGNLP